MQPLAPVVAWYFPGWQEMQTSLCAEAVNEPAWHLEGVVDPLEHVVPGGHAKQSSIEVWLVAFA